jgi:hypothetical protein
MAAASRVEGRGAGHTKTYPAVMQLTTLELDYASGACHDELSVSVKN